MQGQSIPLDKDRLGAIGLKPKAKRIYELVDGNKARMDLATGDIEFMGEHRRRYTKFPATPGLSRPSRSPYWNPLGLWLIPAIKP